MTKRAENVVVGSDEDVVLLVALDRLHHLPNREVNDRIRRSRFQPENAGFGFLHPARNLSTFGPFAAKFRNWLLAPLGGYGD